MNIFVDKILDMVTANISRKFVDSLLYISTKRIEFELIDYLCQKRTDEDFTNVFRAL